MNYPEEVYPTHFYFYFSKRDNAKKLGLFLEGKGLKIIELKESEKDVWLLLAFKNLIGDESGYDYFDQFKLYADIFNGDYDGHETEIKL